jgi:hypothetical protein
MWPAGGAKINGANGMRAGSRSCQLTGMEKMPATNALELRIMQMRIWALVAAERIDGQHTVTLARHGEFEVRLIELPQDPQSDNIPLWIELFEHVSGTTLDSCGGHDLAHMAVAAGAFISQARDLQRVQLAFAPLTASRDVSGD